MEATHKRSVHMSSATLSGLHALQQGQATNSGMGLDNLQMSVAPQLPFCLPIGPFDCAGYLGQDCHRHLSVLQT